MKTFSLCQNINSSEKFGIDDIGELSNNKDLYFCYVVDGHGGCKNSEILVKYFHSYILSLEDEFHRLNNTQQEIEFFFEQLIRQFYVQHRGSLRPAAMSVLMVIFSPTHIYSANLGDCRLGFISEAQQIHWITYPHNAAMSLNTDTDPTVIEMNLKNYVIDNPVTKSFNTKKLKSLSFKKFDINTNVRYFLASDGFWMLPDNDARAIIYNKNLSGFSFFIDDISVHVISFI